MGTAEKEAQNHSATSFSGDSRDRAGGQCERNVTVSRYLTAIFFAQITTDDYTRRAIPRTASYGEINPMGTPEDGD